MFARRLSMQVTTHIVVERVSKVWEQASYTLTVDLPDDTSPNLIEQEAKAAARHHHDEYSYPSSLEWSEEDSETENTALVRVAVLDVESAMRRASMVRLYQSACHILDAMDSGDFDRNEDHVFAELGEVLHAVAMAHPELACGDGDGAEDTSDRASTGVAPIRARMEEEKGGDR